MKRIIAVMVLVSSALTHAQTVSDRPLYEKRFPSVRSEPLAERPPVLPLAAVQPLLLQPLVVTTAQLTNAGRIIAIEEGRTMAGWGDRIFARQVPPEAERVFIFRPTRPVTRPGEEEVLGYETHFIGEARVESHETAQQGAVLRLTQSREEIRVGDRVLVPEDSLRGNFTATRAPEDVRAHVIRLVPKPEAGPYEVIVLDAGENVGLAPGHVLALKRARPEVTDPETRQRVALPEQRYAVAMVAQVFDRLSYALVLDANASVRVGDRAETP